MWLAALAKCMDGHRPSAAPRPSPPVRPPLYEGVVRKKGGGALVVRWQERRFVLDAQWKVRQGRQEWAAPLVGVRVRE